MPRSTPSGCPDGTIGCRNPASGRASGCAPLNILGDVVQDQAALNYVFPAVGPPSSRPSARPWASFNVNGQPFSNWAGPVAVALGAETAKEGYWVTGDRMATASPAAHGPTTPLTPC